MHSQNDFSDLAYTSVCLTPLRSVHGVTPSVQWKEDSSTGRKSPWQPLHGQQLLLQLPAVRSLMITSLVRIEVTIERKEG
jgi:hypothetical protein